MKRNTPVVKTSTLGERSVACYFVRQPQVCLQASLSLGHVDLSPSFALKYEQTTMTPDLDLQPSAGDAVFCGVMSHGVRGYAVCCRRASNTLLTGVDRVSCTDLPFVFRLNRSQVATYRASAVPANAAAAICAQRPNSIDPASFCHRFSVKAHFCRPSRAFRRALAFRVSRREACNEYWRENRS